MYHAASEVTRVPLVDGPRKSMETQSMRLQSVRIQRFKRIKDASIDLKTVNVFVGGNNSGKSSLIQGLHFGIGLLPLGFHPAPFFFWVLGAAESRPVGYNRRLVETYGIPTRALAIRTDCKRSGWDSICFN